MCALRNWDFRFDSAALKCQTTSWITFSRFGRCFRKVSAMTWFHFSSKTHSTFFTFTLAPCSRSRSLTRAEISSKRVSIDRCSIARWMALRQRLSTEAYFRRRGPMSEKRLSLFTCSSVNFVSCALTNSSNSWCISWSTASRTASSCPRKALSTAWTSAVEPALRSSLVCLSMSASLSADSFASMCFCTRASQNSWSCCAMSTCRIVRNCSKSVPHMDSVCHTVRACSYHCDNDAKDELETTSGPVGLMAGLLVSFVSRILCFWLAFARAIQWKAFSRSCSAFSA
mmetsp:Transcript_125203/g.354348  ORF Transcript_125203/g.354348 Transcript_125203/m.354348 type:complete len:285 (-) Transcript_125203:233-1087(-)